MLAAGVDVIYNSTVQMSAEPNNAATQVTQQTASLPDIDTQSSGGFRGFLSRHWIALSIAGVFLVTCGPALAGIIAIIVNLFKIGNSTADGIATILGPVIQMLNDFTNWCKDHEVLAVFVYLGSVAITFLGNIFIAWIGSGVKNPKGSMGEEFDALLRLQNVGSLEGSQKLLKEMNEELERQKATRQDSAKFQEAILKKQVFDMATATYRKNDDTANLQKQRAKFAQTQKEIDDAIDKLNESRSEDNKIDKDAFKLHPVDE